MTDVLTGSGWCGPTGSWLFLAPPPQRLHAVLTDSISFRLHQHTIYTENRSFYSVCLFFFFWNISISDPFALKTESVWESLQFNRLHSFMFTRKTFTVYKHKQKAFILKEFALLQCHNTASFNTKHKRPSDCDNVLLKIYIWKICPDLWHHWVVVTPRFTLCSHSGAVSF